MTADAVVKSMVTQGAKTAAPFAFPRVGNRDAAREGANARRIMARLGMTQADVVAATGLDARTLRALLRGESQPHARTLHKFAAGLGVDVDELFFDARAAGAVFDRATNPAVAHVVAANPTAFADWTDADFDELYSRVAVGGELTEAGALAAAEAMNERRELLAKVALILETAEADHLREFVAMLYKRVTDVA
jgi:transcriptional regulator with XRE-family HTH domain